ncbi:unnamed protein product [Candida verbasci]|uniref:DNA polymerase delta subunit 3 n=1 Tax=Candida verbasci TaxID=1227364 RepID=A0A9W4XGF0_9ASCO|nr:unnamed protein product [Candida verbasci]
MPSSAMKEIEYLSTELIKNSKPVTYHKFSRELNLSINKSKEILYDYYQKNKLKLTASFIITGLDKEDKRAIKLCSDESQLDENVAKFKSVSVIHVYCLISKDIQLTNSEIAAEEVKYKSDLSLIKTYEKNGIIIGPEIKQEIIKKIDIKQPTAPVIEIKKEQPKKEIKSNRLSSGYVSRKVSAAKPSLSNHYKSRKPSAESASSIPAKRPSTESSKPTLQYKSRKTEQKKPKDRIIVDDNQDDEMEESEVEQKATRTSTNDLAKMFEDEETFEFTDDDEKEQQPPKLESKKEEIPEDVEMNDVEEEDDQLFVTEEEEEEETAQPKEPEMTKEVDEDGYITVRRKPNPVTKPQSKRPPPKKSNKPVNVTKKSDTNNKKQASLMNFFSKK